MPSHPQADYPLFDLPDELFVSEAYLRVLGRPADPRGYLGYLAGLRRRLSRPGLIGELQRSGEWRGERWSAGAPGLRTAPDLWPGRATARRPALLARPQRDLLQIDGELFVHAACWSTLRRDPGAEELAGWAPRSRSLPERRQLLRELASMARRARPAAGGAASTMPVRPAGPAATPRAAAAPTPPPAAAGGIAAFTVATRSYLPFVRTLMRSLRRCHPEFQLYLLLVDEPGDEHVAGDWITVPARELGLDAFEDMSVRYDVLELSTALKPFFVQWLFEHAQPSAVIYLDPDVRVYTPLHEVLQALDGGAAMVLTPHITQPLDGDGGEPCDHTILQSGAFNLGFAALRRCEEALAFLRWWSKHLRTDALVAFERNLFTDQRWCDLAPAFVPTLAILRHPGHNVAYWNLPHRPLSRDADGGYTAAGQPLRFFHFSGFDPEAPGRLSRYQDRPLEAAGGALPELLREQAAQLLDEGWHALRGLPCAYAQLEGVALSSTLRRVYAELHPKGSTLGRAEALGALLAECAGEPRLPPIARRLHAMRAELRHGFDLGARAGREAYEGWFWSTGIVEHGLVGLMRRAKEQAAT